MFKSFNQPVLLPYLRPAERRCGAEARVGADTAAHFGRHEEGRGGVDDTQGRAGG